MGPSSDIVTGGVEVDPFSGFAVKEEEIFKLGDRIPSSVDEDLLTLRQHVGGVPSSFSWGGPNGVNLAPLVGLAVEGMDVNEGLPRVPFSSMPSYNVDLVLVRDVARSTIRSWSWRSNLRLGVLRFRLNRLLILWLNP